MVLSQHTGPEGNRPENSAGRMERVAIQSASDPQPGRNGGDQLADWPETPGPASQWNSGRANGALPVMMSFQSVISFSGYSCAGGDLWLRCHTCHIYPPPLSLSLSFSSSTLICLFIYLYGQSNNWKRIDINPPSSSSSSSSDSYLFLIQCFGK